MRGAFLAILMLLQMLVMPGWGIRPSSGAPAMAAACCSEDCACCESGCTCQAPLPGEPEPERPAPPRTGREATAAALSTPVELVVVMARVARWPARAARTARSRPQARRARAYLGIWQT